MRAHEREREKGRGRWRGPRLTLAVLDRAVGHLAGVAPADVMAGLLARRLCFGGLRWDDVQQQRQEGKDRDQEAHIPWNVANLVKFRK